MLIVSINRATPYDYAPLGRLLLTGDNEVTSEELAILLANEQIVREANAGILTLPDPKQAKAKAKPKAKEPEVEQRTEGLGEIELVDGVEQLT